MDLKFLFHLFLMAFSNMFEKKYSSNFLMKPEREYRDQFPYIFPKLSDDFNYLARHEQILDSIFVGIILRFDGNEYYIWEWFKSDDKTNLFSNIKNFLYSFYKVAENRNINIRLFYNKEWTNIKDDDDLLSKLNNDLLQRYYFHATLVKNSRTP